MDNTTYILDTSSLVPQGSRRHHIPTTFWYHFGIILVGLLALAGLVSFWWVWWLRLAWCHFDVILVSCGVHLVCLVAPAGLVSFWCHFRVSGGSGLVAFWYHFGIIVVGLVAPAGLVSFWCHFDVILLSFWWV